MVAADSLLQTDPRYLWRRLKVVALEDCYGDPLACALVMLAVRDSNFRRKLGERRVLAALVAGLAEGVKCRDLTHLLLLNRIKPPNPQMWAKYVDGLDMPWITKYLALKGRNAEHLGAQIPLLHRKMPEHTEIIDMPPDPAGDTVIGGVLAAAYDQHATEGKRSLLYFSKACGPLREFYKRNALDVGRTLGISVFFIEGRVTDRKLTWDGQAELCQSSRIRTSMHTGFQSVEQIEEVRRIVSEYRELLNECRRRVIS